MMALDLLSSVRYLLKPEDISIDNWIFRMHYRVTVLILLSSSGIGVAKQYFGDPINCQVLSVKYNSMKSYSSMPKLYFCPFFPAKSYHCQMGVARNWPRSFPAAGLKVTFFSSRFIIVAAINSNSRRIRTFLLLPAWVHGLSSPQGRGVVVSSSAESR
jgi:hypothetical protein